MPQFFSEYLFPTNLIALGILTFLTAFFFYWLIELIKYWRWLRTERKQIENKQNVQPLVTARQERDRGREDNDQKTNPENTFSEFCTEGSLDRESPIAKHLNAIFLAGWDESRLEVGELINHTTSELFKRNNSFRSVLAVFIVIGLFGTLFGLADSLAGLFPALKANVASETSAESSEGMIQALRILLEGMKGALAPSIFGIFFTILGVILYGAYLQFACHPIKAVLERLTLTVWVPQLYPTTSQKLIQTLQESEAQMRSGYQTAVRIDELVETVQTNVNEFNTSLTQAKSITQPLSDSGKQINDAASAISTAAAELNKGFTKSLNEFSEVLDKGFLERLNKFSGEFASSVNKLAGFQDDIRNLYQQFQESANQRLDQHSEKVNEQNQNLIKVLNALNSYEQASINSRKQINEKLQVFIDRATETNTSIYTENREWFEKVDETNKQQFLAMQSQLKTELENVQQTLEDRLKDLTEKLDKNLGNVQQGLNDGLTTLNNRLENFDTPLKQTVEAIKGVFDNRLETLNERLKRFHEPIQQSAAQMRDTYTSSIKDMKEIVGNLQEEINEQNKKYEEQLTGVQVLNQDLVNLLNQLDTRLGNFGKPLRETVGEIKDTFDVQLTTLNERLEKFDEPIQGAAEQMRDTYADSVTYMRGIVGDLQRKINEQNQKYGEQLTGVKDLNERVEGLLTQLDDSSRNQKHAVDALSTNIGSLTTDVQNLDTAINALTSDSGNLAQSLEAIKGHTEKLGTASQQFVKKIEQADITPLNANIEKLNTTIGEISQNSQDLANVIKVLAKQKWWKRFFK